MELQAGTVLGGRYELERLLGEGGMGAVWAARHVITKKHVALKLLKSTATGGPKALKRFLREARAVSAVQHPNVVGVHDVIQLDDGSPIMVMDLLDGEDLGAKLARETRLQLAELTRLLVPVISAVGTAHSVGIVHRDLKPDNIMLHRLPDGTIVPKVLDFGIAKLSATEGEAAATADLTQTGAVMGTAYYMPPEQLFGEKDIDQRADVWAMGVIIYECLAGRKPIDGDNFGQIFKAIAMGSIQPLEEIAPWVPRDVTALVSRMLVSDRHARARDLREAYEVLLRHSDAKAASFGEAAPIEPPPESVVAQSVDGLARDTDELVPAGVPQKSASRLPLLALTAVLAVGGAGALGVFLVRSPSAVEQAAQGPEAGVAAPAESVAKQATGSEPKVEPVDGELAAVPAPSSSAPEKASGVAVGQKPLRVPGKLGKLPAQPETPAPPKEEPKPEPTSKQIQGGVVGEAPF